MEGSLHAKISSIRAAASIAHRLVMDRQTDRQTGPHCASVESELACNDVMDGALQASSVHVAARASVIGIAAVLFMIVFAGCLLLRVAAAADNGRRGGERC